MRQTIHEYINKRRELEGLQVIDENSIDEPEAQAQDSIYVNGLKEILKREAPGLLVDTEPGFKIGNLPIFINIVKINKSFFRRRLKIAEVARQRRG